MSSSSVPTSSTSLIPTSTGATSSISTPLPTPTTPNNTTFSFKPPPTDNENHCECGSQESCFIYPGGFICQPFTSNNISYAPGVPPFLADNYPSVRYTMPVTNQTAGTNCTTITTPPSRYYKALAYRIMKYDMGNYIQDLDDNYSSTLFQYRGNCAETFYCRPNTLPTSQPGFVDENIQGNLPGTCQPLVAEGGDCLASSMCQGWHVSPDFTYNNDQFRCKMNTKMDSPNHPAGTCVKLRLGSGTVDLSSSGFNQQTARTYILSAMLIFSLAFLYMWYRRQKQRQMHQQMMLNSEGQPYYYDNTATYLQRSGGGVNRQPDENDGELPAYGQHRRDERVTGPAAEEIGMYSFSSGAPPPASPNPAYPASSIRPTQQTYPFSMNHPAFANSASPIPAGPLYPPPQSPPPPSMSASEVEAAALSAAAAAVATPVPAHQAPVEDSRRVVAEGGLLPPSYDSFASSPTSGEKEEQKRKEGEEEGTNPFEGSSAGSSRSTPDLERSKEKAGQDDHESTRSGGSSSRGPDSGRN
ncbi:hypothetical protein BG003_002230 [Podila horticola]|nr:hypothetical protein BG003_002230 [Podila horticola]